ncbi:hypothetical protein LTS18_010758, partial [Coniosporium uncinatum]
ANDPAFSSAAAQLISLYIPESAAAAIYSAANAASITGDPNAVIRSALTATATPSYFSALPSAYSNNIISLESAISELRSQASVGSIPGAARVVTTVDSAGNSLVTTIPGSSEGGPGGAFGSVVSTSAESTPSGSDGFNSATSITGTSSVPESTTLSGTNSASSEASSSANAGGASGSSSTSSGIAAPTQIPGMAAAGALGLLGVMVAL